MWTTTNKAVLQRKASNGCHKLYQVKFVATEELPDPPTPDQSVYHDRTHFREKGDIFSMGSAKSRTAGHFLGMGLRNFEKG